MKLPTLNQLKAVWSGVLKDPAAREALDQLEKDGFKIRHLSPQDPTFHSSSWADYVAAIPLVPKQPSRSRFHRQASLRKHRPLVTALRDFARQCADPFLEKRPILPADLPSNENPADFANRVASLVETFLSWDWYIRERNPRNVLIASLRWEIKSRTRKPHDRELSTIIDAAYRAAGLDEVNLDNTTLDQIERRETVCRVKATRRLNVYSGVEPNTKRKSTRNRKKKR